MNISAQLNCWDFKECEMSGNCPAYPHGGRVCYAVNGTKCDGKDQGLYHQKIKGCRACTFYKALLIDKTL